MAYDVYRRRRETRYVMAKNDDTKKKEKHKSFDINLPIKKRKREVNLACYLATRIKL